MQTAILLGGSGFVGTHLARHLVDGLGYAVVIVDLVSPDRALDGQTFVRADVRESLAGLDLPEAPTLVANLAAIHREPGHQDHEYLDTNVGGATNVLELCDRLGASSLMFTSSIAVYGVSEDAVDDARPVAPETPYGRSKVEAERMVLEWSRAAPNRVVSIARPAAVFGAGEGGNFTRLADALRRRRFVVPGRADTIKGCGYVEDLVRAMTHMHGRPGASVTYNFAFPEPYRLDRICEAFCLVGGYPPPRGTLPLGLMQLAGRMGDAVRPLGRSTGLSVRRIEKLVTSTHIRPDTLLASGFKFIYDLDTAFEHWFAQAPAGVFV